MKRLGAVLAALVLVCFWAVPADASDYVTTAARELGANAPVWVAPGVGSAGLTSQQATELSDRIKSSGGGIYIAVLPPAAAAETSGGVNDLPRAIGQRMGGYGVWGVVAGTSFRAGSSFPIGEGLGKDEAGSIATQALHSNNPRDRGSIAPMLLDFVNRTQASLRAHAQRRTAESNRNVGSVSEKSDSDGGSWAPFLYVMLGLLTLGAVVVGVVAVAGSRRRRRKTREEFEQLKRTANARYVEIVDGVLTLEATGVDRDGKARGLLSEATLACARVKTILDGAQTAADVRDANSDLSTAEAALTDARAYADGRDPVAERAADEKRLREENARAEEERQAAARKRREEQERIARITPDTYTPRVNRTSVYTHHFDGGYYNNVYYGPGYYADPFWTWVAIDALRDDDYDHVHGEVYHDSHDDYSSSAGGGDWSASSNSSSTDSGGGDWGTSSDDYGSSSDASGGGDWSSSNDSSSSFDSGGGGGGDW